MKTLKEYIFEQNNKSASEVNKVWVLKDKDLEGAIFDVCDSEEEAQRLLDQKLKENPDAHMEIVPGDRKDFVKE